VRTSAVCSVDAKHLPWSDKDEAVMMDYSAALRLHVAQELVRMAIINRFLVFKLNISRIIGLIACLIQFMVFGAHACPLQLPSIKLYINGAQLILEIAATPEARRCGLSGREMLPPDAGMLFVLPETMPFAVWMQDTRLPLDIAFLDEAGRVVAIKQLDPQHQNLIYSSPRPVRYAIEVHRGWFAAHHVSVGDNLKIPLPTKAK